MDKRLKTGIVGCGGMGRGHAVAIMTGTGNAVWNGTQEPFDSKITTDISTIMELAGIWDIAEEKRAWARERGIRVYKDYEDMLADPDLDAVLIATPNHMHKEEAIQAMRAGKHVLCEKPVVLSGYRRVIHVVQDGDYEQPVLCFYCDERYWKPKSQDSYWDYWDSSLMLAQMQMFTNEKALKLLEEMNAFDCPCTGFEMFDNVMK